MYYKLRIILVLISKILCSAVINSSEGSQGIFALYPSASYCY